MKKMLFVFFMAITFQLRSQTIKFELFMLDDCADTIGRINFYVLTKDSVIYYPIKNDGIVYLPDTGKYQLSIINYRDLIEYNFNVFESSKDTINFPKIQLYLEPPTSRPNFIGYLCCDEKCNGWQIDYFKKNKKRIEGFFKEGIPRGKLKYYNSTGVLKKIEKYNRRGKLIKIIEYGDHGKIIHQAP